MVVEDVQFLNAFKGKHIKLTLKSSSYFGVVQRINPNKTLVLAEVIGSNGCTIPGTKMFFGHEILNVEFTDKTNTDSGNDDRLEDHVSEERFPSCREKITLDGEDEEDLSNFIVIDEFHDKFGPAVMHIKKQNVISVGADGVAAFKHGRLCWLQIATKNRVYLFDILLLGAQAFKNGLSTILENKLILKVIHDCRAIAGCLFSQFGVKLTNVFDTQVADVMCFHSETGGFLPNRVSTLEEVVSLHLKVPPSKLLPLQMKSQLTQEQMEMWQKRPCPVPLLKLMVLSVVHLQPLRLVLVDNFMMDYVTLVDSYLSSSHYEPDDLRQVRMESVLELPEELRKLEQMCRERREWASSHYHLTEQGLLARFSPRAQSPPQTSPEEQGQRQTQNEAFEPAATMESPSSTQVDPIPHNLPVNPVSVVSVSSLEAFASHNPAAQAPVPATVSDLRKKMSPNFFPGPLGLGRGNTERLMNTMGRGRSFQKDQSSVLALPMIGRGFFLKTQAQVPISPALSEESSGGHGNSWYDPEGSVKPQ